MRIAFLGDIHANIVALDAVLVDLRKRSVDRIVHTGDVVGYGVDMVKVLDRLLQLGVNGVQGNHEQMLLGELEFDGASQIAIDAILWSQPHLTTRHRTYLQNLPDRVIGEDYVMFHATPVSVVRNIKRVEIADRAFRDMQDWPGRPLAVHGHTHIQRLFENDGAVTRRLTVGPGVSVDLNAERRYLMCPGSVGMSRDVDSRSAYAIFDTSGTLEFFRVPYDWRRVRAENRRAGLSIPLFQDRLGLAKDRIARMTGGRIVPKW